MAINAPLDGAKILNRRLNQASRCTLPIPSNTNGMEGSREETIQANKRLRGGRRMMERRSAAVREVVTVKAHHTLREIYLNATQQHAQLIHPNKQNTIK